VCKLRGRGLVDKPGRTRYHVPTGAARTIAALLTLRDQVIGPILAGGPQPPQGSKPAIWTRIDRRYETLRVGMQDLSTTSASHPPLPHRQHFVGQEIASS